MPERFERTTTRNEQAPDDDERAEHELEQLLADADNAFLFEIERNRVAIEEASSAREALAFARDKIAERMRRTLSLQSISPIEGITLGEVNYEGIKDMVDTIMRNALQIGDGSDAYVIVDRCEIRELPPEICYKIAKKEELKRGRNSLNAEARMQGMFHDVAARHPHSSIGIPAPFYALEIGTTQLIAMEKLNAKSVNDIINGKGFLPEWFDPEEFYKELKSMFAWLHKHDLYHRDMHDGNVMISQSKTKGKKIGYIVDFGLSAHVEGGLDAYEKKVGIDTFTYDDDYGIIEKLKMALKK